MQSDRNESFKEFILDQLRGLGGLTSRPMFGGHGLYQGQTFFGIIHKGRLYFKTDTQTQPRYAELGMKPFQPSPKQTLRNYYELPAEVLEDSDRLIKWAQEAVRTGQTP